MITVAKLIELLAVKDQNEQVEALIVTTEGKVIVAYVGEQAKPMTKALKLFKQ